MRTGALQGFDTLLVTNPTNIRYLTGFVGVETREREAYSLLAQESVYVFTSSLYLEQARNLKSQIPNLKQKLFQIIEISRENPLSTGLAKLTKKLGIKKLGFEEADLTVAEYQKLKQTLRGITLVPTKNRIEKLRMIKRPDEIAFIKSSCKLTDQCFDFILKKLKPGITESEIAWEIESFFRSRGAESAFSPIVAFGKNSSQPHYSLGSDLRKPQGQTLSRPDIALLDFGARVNGYCADMTRVVFVGNPTKEWVRAYQTVSQANHAVIDELKDTALALAAQGKPFHHSGASLDRFVRAIIKKAGFPPYPHSLGHNVGLDIHEGPRLSMKKSSTLKPGMVFSVEPAIYVEGKYGIRIEDLVLLKKDGVDILTKSPKALLRL